MIPVFTQYQEDSVPVLKPVERPEPPSRIMCQACDRVTGSEYRKKIKQYNVCFFMTCNWDTMLPHLACSRCGSVFVWNRVSECTHCGIATNDLCKFCPSCGTEK